MKSMNWARIGLYFLSLVFACQVIAGPSEDEAMQQPNVLLSCDDLFEPVVQYSPAERFALKERLVQLSTLSSEQVDALISRAEASPGSVLFFPMHGYNDSILYRGKIYQEGYFRRNNGLAIDARRAGQIALTWDARTQALVAVPATEELINGLHKMTLFRGTNTDEFIMYRTLQRIRKGIEPDALNAMSLIIKKRFDFRDGSSVIGLIALDRLNSDALTKKFPLLASVWKDREVWPALMRNELKRTRLGDELAGILKGDNATFFTPEEGIASYFAYRSGRDSGVSEKVLRFEVSFRSPGLRPAYAGFEDARKWSASPRGYLEVVYDRHSIGSLADVFMDDGSPTAIDLPGREKVTDEEWDKNVPTWWPRSGRK